MLFELIGDVILDMWFAVMQWIVPEKSLGKRAQSTLKVIISVFSCLLLITMVLGLFAIISDEVYTKQIGRYMVFIPLGISVIQIFFGHYCSYYLGKERINNILVFRHITLIPCTIAI